jgi:hypothetical protein
MSASLPSPSITAPLDPGFVPSVLFNRHYLEMVAKSGRGVPLVLGLEREAGLVSRFETVVLAGADELTLRYVERIVKFLLWSRGGWKLHIGGPKAIGEAIRKIYSPRGARKFDCQMMAKAYGHPFEVAITSVAKVPREKVAKVAAGGYLKGCRIGFDLGASDYKVSAVIDGEAVFTEETPWDPKIQKNPEYHYHHISAALHRAAARLPRVDAIGGSSAGIIVDNEIRVASLLRAIPTARFAEAAAVFKRIQKEWKVPMVVMNDGDVTALAGALSLKKKGMLGIAMGSSEAAGYMDPKGHILGWLNELAFAPVDHNPKAPADEWSGDGGVFLATGGQQAAARREDHAARRDGSARAPGRGAEVDGRRRRARGTHLRDHRRLLGLHDSALRGVLRLFEPAAARPRHHRQGWGCRHRQGPRSAFPGVPRNRQGHGRARPRREVAPGRSGGRRGKFAQEIETANERESTRIAKIDEDLFESSWR